MAAGTWPSTAPRPCVLYGYGAYEITIDPSFSSLRLTLLDRGFVFAIAHVRGGGELGRRLVRRRQAPRQAPHLHRLRRLRRPPRRGGADAGRPPRGPRGSAGGLLMGAVANLRPDLFRAVVAEVPFVDCLTTMLDVASR